MTRSTFEDRTPVTVTFETDKGALAALKDNPLLLSEDVEGSWFANAVRRGCRHLSAATVIEEEGMSTAPEYPAPRWLFPALFCLAVAAGFVALMVHYW